MLYRNTAVLIFPLVVLSWYLISRSLSQSTLHPAPLHADTDTTTTVPVTVSYGTGSLLAPPPSPPPSPYDPSKHAYVFYATNSAYACSAIVNFHRLKHTLNTTVPGILLASSGVSNTTLAAARTAGLEVIHDEPPPLAPGGVVYYSQVLLKLRALNLRAVKPRLRRIIVLDADQLILKNLDHLFALPEAEIAAPLAYWQEGSAVTTTLMVAQLSEQLWAIVDEAIRGIRRDEYDMDLVNRVFGKRLMVLPGRYCTLNSHWESLDLPGWFEGGTVTRPAQNGEQLERLYEMAEVVHFTAMGKPWDVVGGNVAVTRPTAHPLLGGMFIEWRKTAEEVCGRVPHD